jgi:hypothetical protein
VRNAGRITRMLSPSGRYIDFSYRANGVRSFQANGVRSFIVHGPAD